ncbi:MAG TPA: histidine kinase [Thermoanaerobaculia bacterium]|nr:histidine kinase [Thermoanaerobaculia bacterium]
MVNRRELSLIVLVWVFFAFLHTTQFYFGIKGEVPATKLSYGRVLSWELACWLLWAVFTPLVVWLSRRVPIALKAKPIALHLVVSVVLSLLRSAGMVVFTMLLRPFPWPDDRPFLGQFQSTATSFFHLDFIVYWGIVGIVHAFDTRRRLRERDLLLAQAQLANLRLQVQPHFLFNTLHTIASLVRDGSSHAAVTMIAGLSDLLRYSLDNAGRDRVPLSEELEVVRRYLEIQQTRFSDQLHVNVEMEPDTRDAAVPTLLLQPLVENAIRHGNPGLVDVRTRRDDGTLVVEIENDGAPLNGHLREGIGLSSTRRRLEQLYGARASLELMNREPAGVVARVRIPFSRELA